MASTVTTDLQHYNVAVLATPARPALFRRAQVLSDSYEQAWGEWEASDDAPAWEAVMADGLDGSS